MKRLIFTLLMFFTAVAAFAQQADKPLVQFSGVVHNADSVNVILPYVTITNLSRGGQASIANYKGYFSFVAHEQDTLKFTCVGFGAQTVVIPANGNKSFTLQVYLKPQVIKMTTFQVLPRQTTYHISKYLINIKMAHN